MLISKYSQNTTFIFKHIRREDEDYLYEAYEYLITNARCSKNIEFYGKFDLIDKNLI